MKFYGVLPPTVEIDIDTINSISTLNEPPYIVGVFNWEVRAGHL